MIDNYKKSILNRLGLTTIKDATKAEDLAWRKGEVSGFSEGHQLDLDSPNDEPPLQTATGRLISHGYRNIGSLMGRQSGKSHEEMQETVWDQHQSLPIKIFVDNLRRNFVIGRGINWVAEDEKLQIVFDDFARVNDFQKRLKEFVKAQILWGEQVYPVFVRETDGQVKLGYIDPGNVGKVVQNPQNSLERWYVILKTDMTGHKSAYRIIREDHIFEHDDTLFVPTTPDRLLIESQAVLHPHEIEILAKKNVTLVGSCMYFPMNNLPNQARGVPSDIPQADFFQTASDGIFGLVEKLLKSFFISYIVNLVGGSVGEVKKRSTELKENPPRDGEVLVSNDRETWDMFSPKLNSADGVAAIQQVEAHTLGSLFIPVHFFGRGDGTNRATAQMQGTPTAKALQSLQDDIQCNLEKMFAFVRDQAVIAGHTFSSEEFEIVMPEMLPTDQEHNANIFKNTMAALVVAIDSKLLSKETASKVLAKSIAELGIEYDPVQELKKIEDETDDEDLEFGVDSIFRSDNGDDHQSGDFPDGDRQNTGQNSGIRSQNVN